MEDTANKKTETKKEHKELPERKHTAEEEECLAKHRERSRRKPLKFRDTRTEDGTPSITPVDVDVDLAKAKMSQALGTTDAELQGHLLMQALDTCFGFVSTKGRRDDNHAMYSNYVMALFQGIQPRDEVEGMLAVQMIGVHNMVAELLRRAMLTGQSDIGKDLNVKQAAKMMRIFVAQMEALKKYRTGGQQKMIVEHVNVNEGGQAIVGTVNQGVVKKDG
ncbi:MAG: hypothetical protein ACYSTF_09115 [Planctomycetota bacterium]|jgi:hypothetical protein